MTIFKKNGRWVLLYDLGKGTLKGVDVVVFSPAPARFSRHYFNARSTNILEPGTGYAQESQEK